jgi:hypothetical protein
MSGIGEKAGRCLPCDAAADNTDLKRPQRYPPS